MHPDLGGPWTGGKCMKEEGCVQMCVSVSLSHVFRYLCVLVLFYGKVYKE